MTFPKYPEYKDSGVEWLGEVPEHWEIRRLKQVVSADRPITYGIVQAGENVEGGIPYIRPADMLEEDGVRSMEGLLKTSIEIAASYSRSSLSVGDLVCSIGPSFGKLMLVPEELSGANLTQGTARVAIEEQYIKKYFFWALRSPESFNQWESSVGGATFRALNLGPLADTRVLTPPRSEQATIAAFLDHETARIDALVEEQQRLIELLKEKRQAVISHAVTKGLDPDVPMKDSGVEWLGEVPAHWDIIPVWMIFELGRGRVISHSEILESQGKYPVYSSQTERDGVMGSIDTYDFDGDYLTWTTDGANAGTVFRRAGRFNCTNVCGTLKPTRSDVDLDYLWSSVSISTAAFIRHDINPKLMNGVMASIRIPVPPEDEQRQIARHIAQVLSKMKPLANEAERLITRLQERRSALISAAVTGKIDVRGWQPPTGSAAYDEATQTEAV